VFFIKTEHCCSGLHDVCHEHGQLCCCDASVESLLCPGMLALYCDEHVCLSVRMSPELHVSSSPYFCASYLRSWLSPLKVAWQYVLYFLLYGLHDICTLWPGTVDARRRHILSDLTIGSRIWHHCVYLNLTHQAAWDQGKSLISTIALFVLSIANSVVTVHLCESLFTGVLFKCAMKHCYWTSVWSQPNSSSTTSHSSETSVISSQDLRIYSMSG